MIHRRVSDLFLSKAQWAQRIEGTQVYTTILENPNGQPLSPESLDWPVIFDFLFGFAETNSGRKRYKSGGALIGERPDGKVAVFFSANSVPYSLEQNGTGAEYHFDGHTRRDNSTVHAEVHKMLAAGASRLKNKILVNCDSICPNCAKKAGLFGIDHYVMHRDSYDRPIYTDRVSADDSYNLISIPVLLAAGIQCWEYDGHRLSSRHENGILKAPVETISILGGKDSDQRAENRILQQFSVDTAEGIISAILLMRRRKDLEVLYAREVDFLPGEEAKYKEKKGSVLPPLDMLFIHASRLGYNLKEAQAYAGGSFDVNCALHTVIAAPRSIRMVMNAECISKGARQILDLSGICVEYPSLRQETPCLAA